MKRKLFLFFTLSILVFSCENPLIQEIWDLKTITFDSQGGSFVPSQQVLKGSYIKLPPNPIRDGYAFTGWYTDSGCTVLWNFSAVPGAHMILYAGWEAISPRTEYDIVLDISGLEPGDSVSFDAAGTLYSARAFNGETVTVYYTLANTAVNNQLVLSAGHANLLTTTVTGTSNFAYTVNASYAVGGIITIRAESIHTNLIILDAPSINSFNQSGEIQFTPGSNNLAAGCTYEYTLYRGSTAVLSDQPIASGGAAISSLISTMLSNTGDYTVRIKAIASNPGYTSESLSVNSSPVYVRSVDLTVSGGNGMDNVDLNGVIYNTNGTYLQRFFGTTAVLTAAPSSTARKVTWSGDGSGTGNVRAITSITAGASVTATFAPKVVPSIAPSTYNGSPVFFLINTAIETTNGTYTQNDGAADYAITYQWYRADDESETNKTAIAGANYSSYTPVSADFGKYIWIEATPTCSDGLTGSAAKSAARRAGIQVETKIASSDTNDSALLGSGGTLTTVYDTAAITIYVSNPNGLAGKTITWTVSPVGGTIANDTATSTTYTPSGTPSAGLYTVTASIISPSTDTVFVKKDSETAEAGYSDLKAALDTYPFASTDSYIITVKAPQSGKYTFPAAQMITILGDTERTISLPASGTGSTGAIFTISGTGRNVTIGNNITLQGKFGNTSALVIIESGANFTMTGTSKITGNTSSAHGGGVYVNDSTFTMDGGIITGNKTFDESGAAVPTGGYGGGVYIEKGTFTMNYGTISLNEAMEGGGVSSNDEFTLINGEIINNSAEFAGGVDCRGIFIMEDGLISDNKSVQEGGGVFVNIGTIFTMSGGTISKNKTTGINMYGGGVYVDWANPANTAGPGYFYKTGGNVYGIDNDENKNTASGNGHALTVRTGNGASNYTHYNNSLQDGTY